MGSTAPAPRAPVLAIYHGGGPLPILGEPDSLALAESLRTRAPAALQLDAATPPRAIIVVTAHFTTSPEIRVSTGAKHDLLYDYYNFPPEAYKLRYNAPGDPEVAGWVAAALRDAGIKVVEDAERGWDHGVFVPMTLIRPAADVPLVQLSIPDPRAPGGVDPARLFALGRALAPLRARNVAILGSGAYSFHNLGALFSGAARKEPFQQRLKAFGAKLNAAARTADEAERLKGLSGWAEWEGARDAQPRGKEEHFSPLLVCAAAAGEGRAEMWEDDEGGFANAAYFWS